MIDIKFIPVPLPVRIKTHPMLPGQVENTCEVKEEVQTC